MSLGILSDVLCNTGSLQAFFFKSPKKKKSNVNCVQEIEPPTPREAVGCNVWLLQLCACVCV